MCGLVRVRVLEGLCCACRCVKNMMWCRCAGVAVCGFLRVGVSVSSTHNQKVGTRY